MKIPLHPEYHYNVSRLIHWWRIYYGDPAKPNVLLVCASKSYLDCLLKCDSLETDLDEWVEKAVEEWEQENTISETVHYLVFANTDEGVKNGIFFLKNEISS